MPDADNPTDARGFSLHRHPWLSMLAVIVATVATIAASSVIVFQALRLSGDSTAGSTIHGLMFHGLTVFVIVPFLLGLPNGRRGFRQYLTDIGFTRFHPFLRLTLLALSCYLILGLSQAAASFAYRLSEGLAIGGQFTLGVFDLSGDLPPRSFGLISTLPSMFEEVAWRGVVLTVFPRAYSTRTAIAATALGFGLIHLLNLASDREVVWVLGQTIWSFTMGLFYGYLFVRTRSLYPIMLVHYLGNAFVGSLAGYVQVAGSVEAQALTGVLLTFGVVPVALMLLWTRYFANRWLPATDDDGPPD